MKEIAIEMRLDDLQRYADVSLPTANKIALKVYTSGNDTAGFVTFNRMLDGARGSGTVELEILSGSMSVFPSSIT
ncbi:hypothetical protein LPJ61_006734, partial [Coemansia biformis]